MSRADDMKEEKKKNKRIKEEVEKAKRNRKYKNHEVILDELGEESFRNMTLVNDDLEYLEDGTTKKDKKRLKRLLIVLILLLILVNLATAGYIVYKRYIEIDKVIRSGVRIDATNFRLDVVDLKSNTRPFAVMIDNNENAWPQFNINEAMVVYEMHVEGGLSRLMAIFKDKPKLDKIGPLRSARHYFLDYVKEYDAIYVHEGYSPRAISEINSRDIDSIVYTNGLFYRDESRWAPHNAITSGQRMIDSAKSKKFSLTTKTKTPLKYSGLPVKLVDAIPATTINTGFSDYAKLKLVYNEKTKKYEKYEIGELLTDAVTKKPLAATNIIILYADSSLLTGYGEGKGRVHIDTTQTMSGYYFTNGEGVKIKGNKKSRDSQSKYTLEDGKELRINDGNTFIFLVPKSQKINIKGEPKKESDQEEKPFTLEELAKDKRIKITRIKYTDDGKEVDVPVTTNDSTTEEKEIKETKDE